MNKNLLAALRDIASWPGRYSYRSASMRKLAALGYVELRDPLPGERVATWRVTEAGARYLKETVHAPLDAGL